MPEHPYRQCYQAEVRQQQQALLQVYRTGFLLVGLLALVDQLLAGLLQAAMQGQRAQVAQQRTGTLPLLGPLGVQLIL